jgi:hypothetical protein
MYNTQLADRVRNQLAGSAAEMTGEKKMFRGMDFMVNNKMCIGVSGENLLCRFDPSLQDEVAAKTGYLPMIMKGKKLNGYCYVKPEGILLDKELQYWINLCLAFNPTAKPSKRKMRTKSKKEND